MADLPAATNIKELVSLFAPGMIILWAHSRVKAGPTPEFQERLIGYAAASAAYFAAISPLFYVSGGFVITGWLWSLLHYAISPFLIGLGLAYISQNEWEYKAASLLGLNFSHHIPAAWDYTFSKMQGPTFILVTLKSGVQIAGVMSSASFASSSKDERDLLIEEVWEIKEEGWEKTLPRRSILLCGHDIDFIEQF